MKQSFALVFPLVRGLALRWGGALLLLALAWGGLWGARYILQPGWQKAEAEMQAAQALLDEARTDQGDIETHRGSFDALKAAGLVGGEPRAVWVEDLLRTAQALGLQSQTSFTLAAPQAVELPEAEAAGARVTRHVLEYSLARVHEVEALRFAQQYHQAHGRVSRPVACTWEQPTPEGLTARCRVNFLHIDPVPAAGHNAGT